MIRSMDEMMVSRLLLYKKRNKGLLPERVLVYRDGVSEGQFNKVLKDELPKIQDAFREVYGDLERPKLTILICGSKS
jgi:eukaryotic translation initiation factor 2C